jgi:hypothetical protein
MIHGKVHCTRANIDEYNVAETSSSDESEEEEQKPEPPKKVVAKKSKAKEPLRLITPKQSPPTSSDDEPPPKKAPVKEKKPKEKPKEPPKEKKPKEKIPKALLDEIEDAVPSPRGSKKEVKFPPADFENGITIDDYLNDANDNSKLGYHYHFLTSCVAVTSDGTYIVKQRLHGKIAFKTMDKRSLVIMLETKSATLSYRGRNIDIGYARLLDMPVINNNLKRWSGIGFAGSDPTIFNVWRGHAHRVFEEDERVDMSIIEPWLAHVKDVICAGREDRFSVVMQALAWIFQNPNGHLHWAFVLMGDEGAGKGTFTDVTCECWGAEYSQRNINQIETITDDKTRDQIQGKKIICPNELKSLERSGKAAFEVLKSRITDDTFLSRNLWERHKSVWNVSNYIFSTNNYDSISMGVNDRRYMVLEVDESHVGDIEYFAALRATFTEAFFEHLLNYFLRYTVTGEHGFSAFKPIETELKKQIKEANLSLPEQFMEQFVWKPAEIRRGLTTEELWIKYVAWADKLSLERTDLGRAGVAFGMKIARYVTNDRKKIAGKTRVMHKPKVEEVAVEETAEPEVEPVAEEEDEIETE